METINGVQTFYANTREEWRKWLDKHRQSEKSVWLIVYQKKSKTPSVHFHDAIVDALCFGWVDSKAIPRDEESFYLFFSPRNPKSTWGKINRERAEEMIMQGLMMPAGQAAIDLAETAGTWDALADAQNLVIPDDLQKLFDKNETAFKNFRAFPPSSKRVILEWIAKAKRSETRERRIVQTIELATNNTRANHH
ncbi:MAG: YdeI/OmpD-associated family protein [Chloroflexia bacterium]